MESIEFILVKFSHCPETRSLKEKVKVLVVFGLLCATLFPFHLHLNGVFHLSTLDHLNFGLLHERDVYFQIIVRKNEHLFFIFSGIQITR